MIDVDTFEAKCQPIRWSDFDEDESLSSSGFETNFSLFHERQLAVFTLHYININVPAHCHWNFHSEQKASPLDELDVLRGDIVEIGGVAGRHEEVLLARRRQRRRKLPRSVRCWVIGIFRVRGNATLFCVIDVTLSYLLQQYLLHERLSNRKLRTQRTWVTLRIITKHLSSTNCSLKVIQMTYINMCCLEIALYTLNIPPASGFRIFIFIRARSSCARIRSRSGKEQWSTSRECTRTRWGRIARLR